MRWNSFSGSVLFAAAAALAYFPYALVALPWLGSTLTLATFLCGSVSLYLAGACATWHLGVRLGLLSGLCGGVLAVLSPSPMVTVFGLVVILAVARSALAYRAKVGRALLTEVGLGVAGIGLATFLFRDNQASLALAIWGFYLVQSLFFLIAGKHQNPEPTPGRDPFEAARARAMAIMEEPQG